MMIRNFVVGAMALSVLAGCTRIETGTVGLRVDASRQIQGAELLPGSWNQTLVGSVLEFPVRDIAMNLENKTPLTADNSALSDFDVSVVYSINPSSVSDLYSNKSKSFHAIAEDGDVFLMYNYVVTLVNNASYKAIRQYGSLELADKRELLETDIKNIVEDKLKQERLDGAITLTAVQIRNIKPNQQILNAATQYVKAQNELKVKQTEVEIAEKEAERLRILAATADDAIAYKRAEAEVMIAEAVRAGRVNTIIIPSNLTMLGNVSK